MRHISYHELGDSRDAKRSIVLISCCDRRVYACMITVMSTCCYRFADCALLEAALVESFDLVELRHYFRLVAVQYVINHVHACMTIGI